jgi:hypothetical protein
VRRIAEDLTPHENPKSHIYNSWGMDLCVIFFACFAEVVMYNFQEQEEEGISHVPVIREQLHCFI